MTLPVKNVVPLIMACMLVVSSLLPRGAQAAPPEVNGVFLFIDDYTNDSIVDAWAALNFTDAPIPQPNKVDNVSFEWFAPNGTIVFSQIVDPNDAAWALSSFRATVLGRWTVNATYTTNVSVHASLKFLIVPNVWGPGPVHPTNTTVVGRQGELAIYPGTQVLFPSGGTLRVQGKLTAVGTVGSPILFSSNASAPAAGDWNTVSFVETADNSSRISHAQVQYSFAGVRTLGASPRIDNVTFSNNANSDLRLTYSSSLVRDLTINGAVYGLSVIGSDADIARVAVTGSAYGILFQGMGGHVTQFTATGCTQIGVYVYNGSASVTESLVTDTPVGISADDSAVTAEDVTITRTQTGVAARGGSNILITNSTIVDVTTSHYSASGSSRITALNMELVPPTPMRRDLQDDSTLVIQNFLQVLVRSFDTGAVISGALVEVRDNGTLTYSGTTDSNGLAGPLAVTYGIYNHTAFFPKSMTVIVKQPGYLFDRNNRTVIMVKGHIEVFNGSVFDNDHDGIPDFVDTDDDNDGLSDLIEQGIGTDPKKADTDGDGMPDGYEFNTGFDPLDPSDGQGDKDGDELTNTEEYRRGTDQENPDTDGDGMSDGWEVRYGFNPLNSSDANGDPDADGYTNLEEFRNGTDPRNPESKPPWTPPPSFLGAGDYWPILTLPLFGLVGIVVLVLLAFFTATPMRRRRREIPPEEPEEQAETASEPAKKD